MNRKTPCTCPDRMGDCWCPPYDPKRAASSSRPVVTQADAMNALAGFNENDANRLAEIRKAGYRQQHAIDKHVTALYDAQEDYRLEHGELPPAIRRTDGDDAYDAYLRERFS